MSDMTPTPSGKHPLGCETCSKYSEKIYPLIGDISIYGHPEYYCDGEYTLSDIKIITARKGCASHSSAPDVQKVIEELEQMKRNAWSMKNGTDYAAIPIEQIDELIALLRGGVKK